MNLLFKDINGEEFSLGTCSFDIINRKDVFDDDDLDNNYYSDIMVELKDKGCQNVAHKIEEVIYAKNTYREDLVNKLEKFVEYLKNVSMLRLKLFRFFILIINKR
jgi:hypothetical protein